MDRNKYPASPLSWTFFFFVSIAFFPGACKPVIKSFKVTTHDTTETRKITADDTLKVNWDIKGKPTLLVNERASTDSGVRILEMKLVVEKGGKEANQVVQVELLPKNSTTSITFPTKLRGDTLVADDHKNSGVWGDRFEILSVSNASNRLLTVTHANRTALLDQSGTASNAFDGTPVEGRWIFMSLLTPAEIADHSLLPERLQINTTIIYKRR
ncbi:MAG: hypothetical protein ABI707_02955 [Ferruginibacter sp.]